MPDSLLCMRVGFYSSSLDFYLRFADSMSRGQKRLERRLCCKLKAV